MKIKLEFDTDHPETGMHQKQEAERCMKSADLCSVLYDYLDEIRIKEKITDDEVELKTLGSLKGKLFNLMEDRGISLDELWN